MCTNNMSPLMQIPYLFPPHWSFTGSENYVICKILNIHIIPIRKIGIDKKSRIHPKLFQNRCYH